MNVSLIFVLGQDNIAKLNNALIYKINLHASKKKIVIGIFNIIFVHIGIFH